MRLEPIEKPSGLILRIAYWLTRRRYGKVLTPLKVVYARMPESLRLAQALATTLEKGVTLDADLTYCILAKVASVNGCGFCLDIAHAHAVQRKASLEKLAALTDSETNPLFSERDRAALAYVEEVTCTRHATDETFERLRKHFSEREIVEITWLNALENYYNLLSLPLEIEADGLCAIPARR